MRAKREYGALVKKLMKWEQKGCNESAHIVQDEVYRKFIKDVAEGKVNKIEEAHFISELIVKRVMVHDKNRWYA